jgi:hypothetical protein
MLPAHNTLRGFILHPRVYHRTGDIYHSADNLPYSAVHNVPNGSVESASSLYERNNALRSWMWDSAYNVRLSSCAVLDKTLSELLVIDILFETDDGSQFGIVNVVFCSEFNSTICDDLIPYMNRLKKVCNESYCFQPTCLLVVIDSDADIHVIEIL